MSRASEAEGWYVDPYRIHQHRWFSAGRPTALVRDGGIESEDPAPAEPFDGAPVRVTEDPTSGADGADLRRADDAAGGDSYDPEKAFMAALDATTWFPMR